jgi:hypothetical protein
VQDGHHRGLEAQRLLIVSISHSNQFVGLHTMRIILNEKWGEGKRVEKRIHSIQRVSDMWGKHDDNCDDDDDDDGDGDDDGG